MNNSTELVLECVRALGEMDDIAELKLANEKTKLFGPAGHLDSIGLVTLLIEIEQKVSDLLSKQIVLASEKAVSRTSSPFRNVESLATFVDELIAEAD